MKDQATIDRFEKVRDRHLEQCRRFYVHMFNPLYVWDAIGFCNVDGYPPRPLPQWCMDYLVTVAVHMRTLGNLNDPRTYPRDLDPDDWQATSDRIFAWQRKKITGTEAANRLAEAMALTRRGWNAFTRHEVETRNMLLATLKEDLPEDIKQKTPNYLPKYVEPRAAKRQIERGQKLRDLPSPPE